MGCISSNPKSSGSNTRGLVPPENVKVHTVIAEGMDGLDHAKSMEIPLGRSSDEQVFNAIKFIHQTISWHLGCHIAVQFTNNIFSCFAALASYTLLYIPLHHCFFKSCLMFCRSSQKLHEESSTYILRLRWYRVILSPEWHETLLYLIYFRAHIPHFHSPLIHRIWWRRVTSSMRNHLDTVLREQVHFSWRCNQYTDINDFTSTSGSV